MYDAQAPQTAYVQPAQSPALAPCLKTETRLAEVTNLLTGQQIVAIADGAPCCYRKDGQGKGYSSVYKNGTCKADTTYLCFRQQMERLLAAKRQEFVAETWGTGKEGHPTSSGTVRGLRRA